MPVVHKHNKDRYILGVDVGGSHISAALIDTESGCLVNGTLTKTKIFNHIDREVIINDWIKTFQSSLHNIDANDLLGIGIAVPGPFNYEEGICLMKGVNKYDALYGVNISTVIRERLQLKNGFPVKFENDASCFALGESLTPEILPYNKIIAITLGTGFGAAFIENNQIQKKGRGIPLDGHLYNSPYKGGIAEDFISSAWLLKRYHEISGERFSEVFYIAEQALLKRDENALQVFQEFGEHLAACLLPWVKSFNAECLVIGGSISKSAQLFVGPLQEALLKETIQPHIKISTLMEVSAITGAATLIDKGDISKTKKGNKPWRNSSQDLIPINNSTEVIPETGYNIYPSYNIGGGNIFSGYRSLAAWIGTQKTVMIDGYGGNDWTAIRSSLSAYFVANKINACWYETTDFQKDAAVINQLVDTFLGEPDSVWGTRSTLSLIDFYEADALTNLQPARGYDLSIIIGTGAALAGWQSLVYVDLPKNEIQYRMRAGSIYNLGNDHAEFPVVMYKRFYFVDWVVLNKHRQSILDKIMVVADGQWKTNINWGFLSAVQQGLKKISADVIRVRPWFEAGAWGGQWMKNKFSQINKNEINYAWSFELIAPENGLILESDGNLLEISFDWLMELQAKSVLGKDEERFGTEFPIRFDFLDTFDGGSLSIQCHPSVPYIQKHFGENITQDETYYILDCKDKAKVYLGFQENINPEEFRQELEASVDKNQAIDIENYVQSFESKKHDLFLIPNGTIHSAGKDNMVLEISATPYIFTFKMYDWVRLDLEGNPRPINIEHAFKNLNFERKGDKVKDELISKQTVVQKKDDWQIVQLSTHTEHFYAVQRIEFLSKVQMKTGNQCQVMMLVEGESVEVITKSGKHRFHYAETFIIPAATGEFEFINTGKSMAKVIQSFIK